MTSFNSTHKQASSFSRRETRPSCATAPPRERGIPALAGTVERREAPEACEAPLGEPCDRPACTPTALSLLPGETACGACAPSDVGRSASRRSTLATSPASHPVALETPPARKQETFLVYNPIGLLSRASTPPGLSSQLTTAFLRPLPDGESSVAFTAGQPSLAPPDTDGRHGRSGHGTWVLLAVFVVHGCRSWLSVTGYRAARSRSQPGNGSESL